MSDDSFFKNPTVQQILQKQGVYDNEQSTGDFIKDLLIGSLFDFGTSYFQALPGAKREAATGIQNNINEALGDDRISWADNTSYRNDYHEGKYSVDVMLMLYEPIFYSVMNIGESANVNYRLDEDLKINDLDNNPKEKEQETLSSIKDIRRTVMAKEPNLKAMPENFSEQTKLAKSLLERGV